MWGFVMPGPFDDLLHDLAVVQAMKTREVVARQAEMLVGRHRRLRDGVQAVLAKALAGVREGTVTATQVAKLEARAARIVANLDAAAAGAARAIAARAAGR